MERNPVYGIDESNCQKFAYEFIWWLTGGNFKLDHRFNAGQCEEKHKSTAPYQYAAAEGGSAIWRMSTQESRGNVGPVGARIRGPELQAQAVAGPGLGVFADASTGKAEFSVGNVVGFHLEPNVNTGVGVRNGNAEAHLLGFGAKVGADGVEINTPIGGVNACALM